MKNILIITCIFFLLTGFVTSFSIYEITINTASQKQVKLDTYKGRKMLFLILPASIWSDPFINDLNAFTAKHQNNVAVIGIIPNGSSGTNTDSLSKKLIQKLKARIVFTHESYMHNRSADSSITLIKWLTDKKLNGHFDAITSSGKKFFVDESGSLYAVTGPEVNLMSSIIDKIINKKQ